MSGFAFRKITIREYDSVTGTGTDVTWVDFTGGRSQIVTNGDDPVGPCS